MAGDQDQIFSMEFGQMAGEDDEVIVSLPADTGAVITKAADTVLVKTGGAATVDDPVEDLKGQFAAMTQRATNAERVAHEATQTAQQTQQRLAQVEGQVVDGQLDTVLSGIAAADAEATSAMQEYVTAGEAGDFAAQARAQRKISGAESRLQRLQEAKADLEDAAKRRPDPTTQRREQPARPSADPVEQMIAAGNISPKSASWLRSHPDCVTDPKKNARMLAAHNLAVVDDIALDSDEYFRRIEEGISPVTKTAAKPASDGRRPSSAAAPAGGSGGPLNGGSVDVTLTRGEALSATDGTIQWNYSDPTGQNRWQKGDPIGVSEFARRKHEGMKAGLYDKSGSAGS